MCTKTMKVNYAKKPPKTTTTKNCPGMLQARNNLNCMQKAERFCATFGSDKYKMKYEFLIGFYLTRNHYFSYLSIINE